MVKKYQLKFIITITFAAMIISGSNLTFAATQQDLNNAKAKQQQAQALANQKAAEAAQIKTQIGVISGQISESQTALNKTTSDVAETEKNIDQLTVEINQKQTELESEKTKLSKVVANWYMQGDYGVLETMIGANNLSDFLSIQKYYDSIKQQITSTVTNIKTTKAELDGQKAEQEKKQADLVSLQNQQTAYRNSIQSQKNQQTSILGMTQTQQKQYLDLVAKYQTEITQIQSQLSRLKGTAKWGTQIVSGGGISWYYTQLGNWTRMGGSPFYVNDLGCLVTSIAMVATYYGHSVTPTAIATTYGSFSEGGYLQSVSGIGVSVGSSQSVNWSTVDSQIGAGRPVIVSVYIPSVGKINGDGSSHFVVIYGHSGGAYLMADPLGYGRGYNLDQVRSMKLVSP